MVLRACIDAKTPVYVDLSDPLPYIRAAKAMAADAHAAGTCALICAGAFPGLSNVLAMEAASLLPPGEAVGDIDFSYFTAGLGGSGKINLYITNEGFGTPVSQSRDSAVWGSHRDHMDAPYEHASCFHSLSCHAILWDRCQHTAKECSTLLLRQATNRGKWTSSWTMTTHRPSSLGHAPCGRGHFPRYAPSLTLSSVNYCTRGHTDHEEPHFSLPLAVSCTGRNCRVGVEHCWLVLRRYGHGS